MISDYDLFVNKHISVPKDMGQLNCAAYVAGIVKGALEGAGFPARYPCVPSSAFQAATDCRATVRRTCPLMTLLPGDSKCSMQSDGALCPSQGTAKAQDDHPHEV